MTGKKEYDEVVDVLTTIFRTGQARAIQTMWKMGEVVDAFLTECEKPDGSRYGTYGIDQLSQDLERREVAMGGRSTLYHCRKIFITMSFEQIEALAARGYTTKHVKALLPLSDELRERIHAELVDPKTNEIITYATLADRIRSVQTLDNRQRITSAVEASPADTLEQAVDAADAAEENGYTTPEGEATPDAEGNPELTTPDTDGPSRKATSAPDYSKPPLPAVKRLVKALDACLAAVPDAVIALKEVPKVGFDSTVAAKNWVAARTALAAVVVDIGEFLPAIRSTLDESARTDGLAEYTAPTADDRKAAKKRKRS